MKIQNNLRFRLPVPCNPVQVSISEVISPAISIAIVGYAVAVSIAKVFANKFDYKIRPNQV